MGEAQIVRDIHTGQKLGVHVRTEATHYVYQDRKGRFGLARLDRSELIGAPARTIQTTCIEWCPGDAQPQRLSFQIKVF